jgi:hypothetical protein
VDEHRYHDQSTYQSLARAKKEDIMLSGSCLCRGIRFEITGKHSKIGMCHCSLCRKVSGVGSTAGIEIAFNQLTWVSGKEFVTAFERPSGYGSAFCRVCGSPAPDSDREQTMYVIPVGLLDDNPALLFGDHIYVASKASWDVIGDDAPQFALDESPPRARDQTA